MDLQILIWCVLVPAGAVLVGTVCAWGVSRQPTEARLCISGELVVVGFCAALIAAWYGRGELVWWPEDAWRRMIWPLSVTSIVLAVLSGAGGIEATRWRWLVAGIGSITLAYVALPSGDGWGDLQSLHRPWFAAISAATLINLWALDGMSRRKAERWVLFVALAGLGGPLMLAATTYGTLAEWVVAGVVATAVAALVAVFWGEMGVWVIVYPATMLATSTTLSGRFYSYEDHPNWLYGVMLFFPAMVAVVDWPLRERKAWIRVVVAAVVAVVCLGVVAWKTLGGAGEEEW